MTTFRKTVTATLAALTLATTFAASGAEARPDHHPRASAAPTARARTLQLNRFIRHSQSGRAP